MERRYRVDSFPVFLNEDILNSLFGLFCFQMDYIFLVILFEVTFVSNVCFVMLLYHFVFLLYVSKQDITIQESKLSFVLLKSVDLRFGQEVLPG